MNSRLFPSVTVLLFAGLGTAKAEAPRVTIDSSPPGANVFVDGKEKGISCQSGPACKPRISRGSHRLTLELEGFKPFEQTINVESAQRFAFTLQPMPARLEIKTLASNTNGRGGEIFIDGALAGAVPADIEVSSGKHMIEVRRPGMTAYTESVDVKGAEKRAIFVSLNADARPVEAVAAAPSAGSMVVTSEMGGAEVFVDDQARGPVPVLVENLPPGDHIVEVRPTDGAFRPWRHQVRVMAGQQAMAYATFTANPPPPGPGLQPVALVPRKAGMNYVVTLGNGQACTTPCTLYSPSGPTTLHVNGPGTKSFQKEILVPDGPSQITVQHFTLSRAIAGPILLILGLPLAAAGGWLLTNPSGPRFFDDEMTMGGLIGAHGLAFTIAGIIELATIKRNRAEVGYLGSYGALDPATPRLSQLATVGIAY